MCANAFVAIAYIAVVVGVSLKKKKKKQLQIENKIRFPMKLTETIYVYNLNNAFVVCPYLRAVCSDGRQLAKYSALVVDLIILLRV